MPVATVIQESTRSRARGRRESRPKWRGGTCEEQDRARWDRTESDSERKRVCTEYSTLRAMMAFIL